MDPFQWLELLQDKALQKGLPAERIDFQATQVYGVEFGFGFFFNASGCSSWFFLQYFLLSLSLSLH